MTGAERAADLRYLKERLIAPDRLESLALELLGPPNPATRGRKEWRWGAKGSAALVMHGPKRGQFYSHESSAGGSPLDLIMEGLRCDFAGAVAFAKSLLGIEAAPEPAAPFIDPESLRQNARRGDDAERDQRNRIGYARHHLWAYSVPLAGTIAEAYLSGRGIEAPAAGWPDCLRYQPNPIPTLIIAATDAAGDMQAVQSVYLTAEARKIDAIEAKARRLPGAKQSHGVVSGAVVRLPGDAAGPLMVAEGPETGLSVWTATGAETWIALGSMSKITPPHGRRVVACRDDDRPGSPADQKLCQLVADWQAGGASIVLATPWPVRRGDGSDFNDILQAGGTDAVRVRIAAAEAPGAAPGAAEPAEAPANHVLPAYYPAATESRDAALDRQNAAIRDTIEAAAARVVVARQIAIARKAARDACEGWAELTPAQKGAITRPATQAALAEAGLTRLPPVGRVLVSGAQGTGKTTEATKAIAAIRGAVAVDYLAPTHEKADEFARDYAKAAGPDSLPAVLVLGRGALDWNNVSDDGSTAPRMCPRYAVTGPAAEKGINVRKTICPSCPLFPLINVRKGCGSIRQEFAIKAIGDRRLRIATHPYVFVPMPGGHADIVVVDESVVLKAQEFTEFLPESLRDPMPYPRASLADAKATNLTINSVLRAVQTAKPLAELAAAGITADTIRAAIQSASAQLESYESQIDGRMPDKEILAVLESIPEDTLGKAVTLLRAVLREMDLGRDTLNSVVFHPRREVKVNGKTEIQPRVRVHHLKPLAQIGPQTTLLLLDGTGSLKLNRLVFGADLQHVHTPIERDADVTGTKGKSYSRQSITGQDQNGKALPRKAAEAAKLRREIVAQAARMPGPFVAGSKGVEDVLRTELPDGTAIGHFGNLRGMNKFEDCPSGLIVGREFVSIEKLEDMARCFMGADPEPFVSFNRTAPTGWPYPFWPYRATRGRRMRDGTVQPVEVEIHPDPRCQEVLEQLREAEVIQAVDRIRPVRQHRDLVLMNELALDVTYDRTVTHAQLVVGGTAVERALALAVGGVLPLAPAWLQANVPGIESLRAAERLAADLIPPNSKYDSIWRLAVYRTAGQRGVSSKALVRKGATNPRDELARLLGADVVDFRMDGAEATGKAAGARIFSLGDEAPFNIVPVPPPAVLTPLRLVDPVASAVPPDAGKPDDEDLAADVA